MEIHIIGAVTLTNARAEVRNKGEVAGSGMTFRLY